MFPFSAPVGFESYTILLEKTTHWRDNYSFTGNEPQIAEAMGLIGGKNTFAVGMQSHPSDTRYYIPESVNGYTVVGIAHDEGHGAGYQTFRSYQLITHMKEIYCPPSCRFLVAFQECLSLTDIYIAADSFYMAPNNLPLLEYYYAGYSPYDPLCANFQRPITIHAKPDAWCEYAGMTISEYLSQPGNEYRCRFEAWDPSTVY